MHAVGWVHVSDSSRPHRLQRVWAAMRKPELHSYRGLPCSHVTWLSAFTQPFGVHYEELSPDGVEACDGRLNLPGTSVYTLTLPN
jgi:hypothetical protein